MTLALAAVLLAALSAACGATPPTESSSSAGVQGERSGSAGVFFPRRKPGLGGFEALVVGRLILDDAGCLRLSDEFGDRTVPLWQPRHELGAGNGGVRVLDARGRTIVRVGGKASLGGGGVKTGWVKGGLVDERTGRELLERCPGNYFLVGEALVADRGR